MAANSEDDSEFEGFLEQDLDITERTRENINHGFNEEDMSDIEISDLDSDSDHSDAETDVNTGRWTTELTHSVKFAFKGPTPGPTITLSEEKKEVDFFNLFFTEDCIDTVVKETNRYAEQRQAIVGVDRKWKEVCALIILQFYY
jgi:hypothetical protein